MTNNKGFTEQSVESSTSPGQTLLDRVTYAKTLWAMTFADHKLAMPEDAFFVRSLSLFSMAEFEYAVGRVARKFPVKRPARPPFVTLDDLCGYCVGILHGERRLRGKPLF
jgi:hypothetical protein